MSQGRSKSKSAPDVTSDPGQRSERSGSAAGASIHHSETPVARPLVNASRRVAIFCRYEAEGSSLISRVRAEGFEVFSTPSRPEFERHIENNSPDVALVEVDGHATSSVNAIAHIRNHVRGVVVFGLATRDDIEHVVKAMKAGAMDVFVRPWQPDVVLSAIRDALARTYHVTYDAKGQKVIEILGFPALSPRERDVLECIVNGQTNSDASRSLGVSARTIETHRAHIMQKLGARNAADLLRILLLR